MPERWRGVFKVMEESSELNVELSKLCVYPDAIHPDGKGCLKERIKNEIADLYAALDYLVYENLEQEEIYGINERRSKKICIFNSWNLSGIKE